jgi:hypothetical protein
MPLFSQMLGFCSNCQIILSLKKFQPAMGPFHRYSIAAVSDPDPDRGNMETKSCKYFYEWGKKINCLKMNNAKQAELRRIRSALTTKLRPTLY